MALKKLHYDVTIKVMMLGESSIPLFNKKLDVGKSSIVTRFAEDKFSPVFLTTVGY